MNYTGGYTCANCGKPSSMLGHWVESKGGFTCDKKPRELSELNVWLNALYTMLEDAREALNPDEWSVLRSILIKRLDTPDRAVA